MQLTGSAIRASEFKTNVDGVERSLLDVAQSNYHRQFNDDEEKSEYFVPVEWICTKPINEAVSEVGFFGNQNSVCKVTPS